MCEASNILVVDDEASSRALVRGILQGEHGILEAADGTEALEILARESVDLLLLDATMPGMSGVDVCREAKRTQRAALPVLMVTTDGDRRERKACYEAGADRCLSRPIEAAELRLRVDALLRVRRQYRLLRRRRSLSALKDDLVALVIHDLKNPLGGIQALLGVIRSAALDPQAKKAAEEALVAAAHFDSTLDDVLHVRLLEERKFGLERDLQAVSEIVREALASVGPAASERGVDVVLTVEGDALLPLDRKLVRRSVRNLVARSVGCSPVLGKVEVRLRREGGGVEITVADRGSAVAGREPFEKFGMVGVGPQGSPRRCEVLGLYLVQLVVRAHGGCTLARHREGGGSILGFRLGPA